MSENWLFLPCLHLHLLLLSFYSHLPLSCKSQTPPPPDFFFFIYCSRFPEFPGAWQSLLTSVTPCTIFIPREMSWCVSVYSSVYYSKLVSMCMLRRAILSDLYVFVHAWEPLHLNAYAWMDVLVLFAHWCIVHRVHMHGHSLCVYIKKMHLYIYSMWMSCSGIYVLLMDAFVCAVVRLFFSSRFEKTKLEHCAFLEKSCDSCLLLFKQVKTEGWVDSSSRSLERKIQTFKWLYSHFQNADVHFYFITFLHSAYTCNSQFTAWNKFPLSPNLSLFLI